MRSVRSYDHLSPAYLFVSVANTATRIAGFAFRRDTILRCAVEGEGAARRAISLWLFCRHKLNPDGASHTRSVNVERIYITKLFVIARIRYRSQKWLLLYKHFSHLNIIRLSCYDDLNR